MIVTILLVVIVLLLWRTIQYLHIIAKNQVEHAKQFGLIIQALRKP